MARFIFIDNNIDSEICESLANSFSNYRFIDSKVLSELDIQEIFLFFKDCVELNSNTKTFLFNFGPASLYVHHKAKGTMNSEIDSIIKSVIDTLNSFEGTYHSIIALKPESDTKQTVSGYNIFSNYAYDRFKASSDIIEIDESNCETKLHETIRRLK